MEQMRCVDGEHRRPGLPLRNRPAGEHGRPPAMARTRKPAKRDDEMEAMNRFVGGVAHDFNNHLTSILGALSLMQARIEQGRTADLPRCIALATAAAQRAASQTRRLLALARREPLEPMRVDVNAVIAGAEDLLRLSLGPGMALETVLAADAWPTLCDPGQLEDAVLNLASNARDAMPDGGRLVIRTFNLRLDHAAAEMQGSEARPGDYVVLEAADTGMGMPPEVVARLFEPFFTTKPPDRGTGLGLPLVQSFVAQLAGFISVRSEPGEGTIIRIHLPRHSAG